MLLERSTDEILPYAGITLTRFTGMISDYQALRQDKHPGNAENKNSKSKKNKKQKISIK